METLAQRYPPGASIGWHRDAPAFGAVIGVSLLSVCRMRFQRGSGPARQVAALDLPPRSVYVLDGAARTAWQHSIPPTRSLRYSIEGVAARTVPVVVGPASDHQIALNPYPSGYRTAQMPAWRWHILGEAVGCAWALR